MTVLQAVALALPALGAPAVVLTRDVLRMVLVVSTVAYPLILLVAIARVRGRK